ncbi:NapC/NirT cytochrome c family protein [Desulfomonile tiedjei]|uniref:NapC/NirT cytochrome c family, N-terminal region n=1 Tax=Desulfomonile tiedjei (strain ATCC 49306 / DSM 6799 / DCB-1) TaxID=706587 RepID=I4CC53_DESTA|nr:NapC/NirT cytochrome c family protein [Desulfomonile tiedjei]AFM27144.1 NapC/NirT cytochrome c family, N-terminal region [Desulfomonile tiedjei DSM 6799]
MGRISWYWYVLAVVALVVVVAGLGEFSVQSSTCMMCHTQEAAYSDFMKARLSKEKKGFSHELIACASCHMKGGAARTVGSRLDGLLHTVSYIVPQLDPRSSQTSGLFNRTRIPSENCQYCHLAAINRKAVQVKDLPPELQKIGLVMDHRKHVIARDDTCARCHERYKDQKVADKSVAYTEVNHLACDSCHTGAAHAYRSGQMLPMTNQRFAAAKENAWERLSSNPRWMVAFPSELSCRRCHNGKIHYKTKIFLADCRNGKVYEDCLKCHPSMTREYFEQHRKKAQDQSLASVREQGLWSAHDGLTTVGGKAGAQ